MDSATKSTKGADIEPSFSDPLSVDVDEYAFAAVVLGLKHSRGYHIYILVQCWNYDFAVVPADYSVHAGYRVFKIV